MNDSKFAVELLTKIGAPLMAAINDVSSEDEGVQEQAAQIMAQLLGQAVQMGTLLYNAVDIQEDLNQADTTRVALTSLCAPLIAKFYVQNKRVPAEDDTKRMLQSLEGVLSFGENFSAASEAQSRLQTMEHDSVLFDKNQPTLVMLQAMVPVINAVEEFPFGQAPRKLVQDIAGKLEAWAQDIVKQQGNTEKLHELMIFKSLAGLYAQCHIDEIKRVSQASADNRDNLSLDPVWEHFETKASMVEALIGLQVGDDSSASDQSSPSLQEDKQPEPQQPVNEAPIQQAPAQSSAPAAVASGSASGGGGPMGFFKKPKEGETAPEASQATPQTTPTETASVQSQPQSQAAPAQSGGEDTATTASSSNPPSNPMGFFKKPKEANEENA